MAAEALTVGPGPPCLKPSDVPATFVELRLAINAGVVAVPSANGYTIPVCSVVSAGPFHPAGALPTATSSSSPTMTPSTTPGSSVPSASAGTTCVGSNLSARVTSSEAALQKQYLQVKVTNIGAAACLLSNPPSLHLRNTVTGAAGPPAPASEFVYPVPRQTMMRAVTLPARAVASFVIAFVPGLQTGQVDSDCQHWDQAELLAGGTQTAVTFRLQVRECAGPAAVSYLSLPST